ncbi:MAG: hypothetical protein I8H91_02800 [Burkholderiales bacterium]|nr:hypothetical protein [Burkholderiales bacterium]
MAVERIQSAAGTARDELEPLKGVGFEYDISLIKINLLNDPAGFKVPQKKIIGKPNSKFIK